MPKSTNMIGNITTVINAGPSVTTAANAINAAGPIMDYVAMCHNCRLRFKEVQAVLGLTVAGASGNITEGLLSVIDSTDTVAAGLINGILACLTGGGSPSTQILADLALIAPTAASLAKAINPAGEIMDITAIIGLCTLKMKSVKSALAGSIIKGLIDVTASSDDNTNKVLLQNLALVLV